MYRLFVAVMLPEEIRAKVCAMRAYLRDAIGDDGIRWVPEEQLHFTLKFLGETQHEELPTVTEVLAEVATEASPWELTVAGIGTFPRQRNPQNLWIGATEGVPLLKKIAEYMNQRLAERGYPEEPKAYIPHVTLARMKTHEGEEMVAKILPTLLNDPELNADSGTFLVQECALMKSELRPEGPIYTPMQTYRFGAENACLAVGTLINIRRPKRV